jgi:N-alpha-acetyltransferase 15/16, NatA auxiliary subunit
MSHHLLKDYDIAINIIDEFSKTQQTKSIDYEQSELLLYQNRVYREAKLYEQSLKHLEDNQMYILDKLKQEEIKGECYIQLNNIEKAKQVYTNLIDRNPDNKTYYKQLEMCLNLSSIEERFKFYDDYSKKYPRCDVPMKMPLEFLVGDEFQQLMDKYLRRALTKGIPPLFKELKHIFDGNKQKLQITQQLVLDYAHNLAKTSYYNPKDIENDGEIEKEAPTTLLWVFYYLAQHYDYIGDTETALLYINKAIDYTPTLVELYMIKAKIYKHGGNIVEAVKWLDEAQSLDTADRFVNYKCTKYMLRANMIKEAQEMAGKFTREGTQPFDYLKEMQCMWFETECANSYRRLGQLGESLKKAHQVERHFQEIIEDQFDFHSYCMRKMTLDSYVDMLHMEDQVKSHEFFFKAAKTAVDVYLNLYDRPIRDDNDDIDQNNDNLTPSELKKLKNKQKKQKLKLEQEKLKQQQMEQKKKELSKQKAKEDGGDVDAITEDDLHADKLERVINNSFFNLV